MSAPSKRPRPHALAIPLLVALAWVLIVALALWATRAQAQDFPARGLAVQAAKAADPARASYRVKGDGVTDDTATLQAYFNSCAGKYVQEAPASSGGLTLKPGVYRISSPIAVGCSIEGTGAIIRATAAMPAMLTFGQTSASSFRSFKAHVTGLTLDQNDLALNGLWFKRYSQPIISRMTFINVPAGDLVAAMPGGGGASAGDYTLSQPAFATATGVVVSSPTTIGATGTATVATGSTTLTITALSAGSYSVGQLLYGASIPEGAYIVARGTSTGGVGTLTMSGAGLSNASNVRVTASATAVTALANTTAGSTTATITSVVSGAFSVGQALLGSSLPISAGLRLGEASGGVASSGGFGANVYDLLCYRNTGAIPLGSACLHIDSDAGDNVVIGGTPRDTDRGVVVRTGNNRFVSLHPWADPTYGRMRICFDDFGSANLWTNNEADTCTLIGFRMHSTGAMLTSNNVFNSTNGPVDARDDAVIGFYFDQVAAGSMIVGNRVSGDNSASRLSTDFNLTATSGNQIFGNPSINVVTQFPASLAAYQIGKGSLVFSNDQLAMTNGSAQYFSASNAPQLVISASSTGKIQIKNPLVLSPNGAGNTSIVNASGGDLVIEKQASPATSAIGAGNLRLSVTGGTTAGTCKIVAYAGTSTTPTTIADNIGGGC